MKAKLQQMLAHLVGIGKELIKLIQSKYKLINQEYAERNKTSKQMQLNARVYDIMRECAIDLYEALGSQSYSCLQKIVNPQSFRCYDYKIVKGMILYRYTLSKQSSDRLPAVIVGNLRDNMNRDITARYHDIASRYGYDVLFANFPILANGIYVFSIADGGEDIILTIASHYQPYTDLLT